MNAKGDANRSVRMTKQRLYQALITLLQQKSLREITVRELTELAGISRGTFYFHYTDIYALMDQMEAAQLKRLNELMDTLIPSISQEDAPPALVALFTYMTENPDLCQALYGKSWESEFTSSVKRLIAERCWGNFAPTGGTEDQKYMLSFAVNGYVAGDVPDYQMSALLMAIYLCGMTDEETAVLTDVMARSGDMVDLSAIAGIKADKHSTGGVGDKTTLVIAPIVAACGVKIAKMSGRGLGHTGGTIDKMEAVPGTRTSLTQEEFFKQVNEIGISVIGQSGKIAAADKKIYALRDVTATVGCIPLIASSIMSKKLAAGSDAILLDVTMGDGAFMKDLDSALELARQMVAIGTAHGRKVAALITDMDKPLGKNIGNSLEVAESMAVLQGKGPADLTEVCLQLASNMLVLAGKGDMPTCRKLAEGVIADGSAFEKCCQMFAAQGGDTSVLRDTDKFRKAKFSYELIAPADGYIYKNDVERIGNASVLLGAGRIKKEDSIDFAAGITMHKKLGDHVSAGESICTLYADDEALFAPAEEMYRGGLVIREEKPVLPPLIYARVTSDGVEKF